MWTPDVRAAWLGLAAGHTGFATSGNISLPFLAAFAAHNAHCQVATWREQA